MIRNTIYKANSIVESHTLTGKKHIALLKGGMSAEREVSIVSSESVLKELINQGYKVTSIDMGADVAIALSNVKPDLVFNCLHGTYGEDGCLPGLLNVMRIPYTHSGTLASAISFNKVITKELFSAHDIRTPESILVKRSDQIKQDPMVRPYVIKPISQGSSVGVELVFIGDEFDFGNYDFPYGDEVIIEKYIRGRELQIAVLNGKAYGTLELKLLKRRFYDYDSKYTEGFAEHLIPANIPPAISDEIIKISEKIYNIIGCNGLVRVECIYDEEKQELFTLELNTHPGMTPLSICQEILAFHGISFSQLIDALVQTAMFE